VASTRLHSDLYENCSSAPAASGHPKGIKLAQRRASTAMSALAPQPSVTDESFGRRLRRERERRQIALSSMAANSKISVSLFKDLERDDMSRWPPGIFRRSFI